MAFDEEWTALRAEAGMRLNQAEGSGGGGGGGGEDLVVNQDDLGAVGSEAYQLYQALTRDGDRARPSTFEAAIALNNGNFTSGSALLRTHDRWNSQMRTLLDACAHISNHLDYTKTVHRKDDQEIAATINASRISEYFK
ncbi:hypothetical protein [Streptomyces sp. GC420]|uniref:hypothetical protein n=1 Tax=Streptomyces sp. GC420 TaxID=2697568 RepID=UPI001415119E|nr:hypothetical protein [Streptomyces sp. GC420]NBM17668.1 hypothetical protein [Streptomyces sp. GC420]